MKKILLLSTILFSCILGNAANLVIDNFESKSIGDTYAMRAWYDTDGTATVAANPTNASEKSVRVVTTNWDAFLQLSVTLPSGKTLADYESLAFDIYIPANANDESPNFKSMNIYLDGEKKHADEGYPNQGNIATWTTKTFTFASLGLSATELAKSSFTIAFGISTENGNYYIDNVKLIEGGTQSGDNIVIDFNDKTTGDTYAMRAWYDTDGTATVAANPTNASDKSVQIVTTNWDAFLQLSISLPSGKTLADYDSFSFDMYIPSNANDESPNYKNMNIYVDGEKKYADEGYPHQADIATWTTKTFTIESLGLSATDLAKSSFTIAFGISTENGNYYIDNVKLTGSGSTTPTAYFTITDFNDKTTGSSLDMKKWYDADGTATVAANPTAASEKSAHIVTSNWDALLQLTVTLPSGKTLANYDTFFFDIYILSNANDESPNYKNMNIYIDGEKKYEDSGYPKQADIATWATKSYSFADLDLTEADKAKNSFTIAFGISTDKGDYYMDNVKLKEDPTSSIREAKGENVNAYIADNVLYLNSEVSAIYLYTVNGVLAASAQNVSSIDVSTLNAGIYIAKINVDGKVYTAKVVK